jgi:uncharacterized protein
MNILIAGGSGLVGKRLVQMLESRGDTVRILTRNPGKSQEYAWNPQKGEIDDAALDGIDVLINLAGAGIADKRWTPARKHEIIDSRVKSNQTLFKALQRCETLPKAFIAASAIGYYGNSGEAWMYESDSPTDESFMVNCCCQWEDSAYEMATLGIRTVILRIGVVMTPEGGAMAEFIKPMRFGIGAYFGWGQAWYSCIDRDDLCNMFMWAADQPSMHGVYNAVSPQPERNIDLVKKIAKSRTGFVVVVPAPSIIIRLLLGEMSATVLNSNRVSADRILETGFTFTINN